VLRFFGLLRNSDEAALKRQSNLVDMYSCLAGTVVVVVLLRPDCGGNEVGDSWSLLGGLRRVFLEEDRGGRGRGGVGGYGCGL
jgi:hypothetical protein